MRALPNWLYGHDPFEPMRYELPLAVVKQRLAADPTFLGQLIRTYLLDNTHRLTVVAEPDPTLTATWEAEEEERLAQAKAAMTPEELQRVVDNTRLLKELQQRARPAGRAGQAAPVETG